MNDPQYLLQRELRFGLHPSDDPSDRSALNNFAGQPALTDIAPWLTLQIAIQGDIDHTTGMLMNIRDIDDRTRSCALQILRQYYYPSANTQPLAIPQLITKLFTQLRGQFLPFQLAGITLKISPFLKFCIHAPEPNMVFLSQRFEFSAAHRLHSDQLSDSENLVTFGKCNNPNGHGHNYELEVTLAGTPDPHTGQLITITQLQKIVNQVIIDRYDHKHLNLDCPEFATLNPTVENITRVIFDRLAPAFAPNQLHHITLWETPKTFCCYPITEIG